MGISFGVGGLLPSLDNIFAEPHQLVPRQEKVTRATRRKGSIIRLNTIGVTTIEFQFFGAIGSRAVGRYLARRDLTVAYSGACARLCHSIGSTW